MDARHFEELAVALERQRRQDYWVSVIATFVVLAFFAYVIFGMQASFTHDQQRIAEAIAAGDESGAAEIVMVIRSTALQTTLQLILPLIMVALPFLFDRYRSRHDKALIELLRAQSKNQAS